MVKTNWVYRKLRDFRAGVESDISYLIRGLARCVWRGLDPFRAYVWSTVAAYNIVVFAGLSRPDIRRRQSARTPSWGRPLIRTLPSSRPDLPRIARWSEMAAQTAPSVVNAAQTSPIKNMRLWRALP
jgi:hypothetical protein